MTCKQLTEFIVDYRSRTLPAWQRIEFEAHLSECPDCVRYLKTYEDTVRLARGALGAPDEPVPADVPEKLVHAILAARAKGR